jgi:uncharacterized membrane protein
LSDGVFAIVLTLLVREIHVPDLTAGQSLTEAAREIRPSFIAFLISFVVVAIAWSGHRDLFALIQRTNRALVWFNVIYLLPLCVLPFGASLLARYDRDPIALKFYGVLLIAIAISRLAIWIYATGRSHILVVPIDRRTRQIGVGLEVVQIVVNGIAILLAASRPTISLTIYAGIPILYFLANALIRDTAPAESAARDFT